MKASILTGLFAAGAAAQSPAWGQCGGKDWKGATTCVSGYTCVYSNDWYSQCIPGSAAPSTTLRTTTTAKPSTTTSSGPTGTSTPGKLKWVGINQSSAEFGQGTYPGIWGKTFTFPSTSSIQVCVERGMTGWPRYTDWFSCRPSSAMDTTRSVCASPWSASFPTS